VPRREFAKTVIVDLDGEKVMGVVPASRHVDLQALRKLANGNEARLATEDEFEELFPDCEVGAMPPFGSLYGTRVFVDELVTEVDDLCFNAGSHEQILRMDCHDYLNLEQPVVGAFAIEE
jgi:Ala-tRNA(Pro) deacylase